MAHSDTGSLEALTSLALGDLGVNMSSRILCAVSGGADSVTMAHVLSELAKQGQFRKLGIIHINHQLRGDESDADEAHVRDMCEKLGLEFHAFKAHTSDRSKEQSVGIEEAARDDRYERFLDTAKKEKYDLLVTAHTINDTLESVLNNMIRGTGLRGLRGIPARRPLSDDVDVIRPWLEIERSDVLRYAEEHGITYRNDSSNDSLQFLRNRLRHAVIPALQEAFAGRNIYDGFRRTMKIIGEATRELDMMVKTLAELCKVEMPEGYIKRDAYMCSEFVFTSNDDAFRRAFVMEVLEKYLRKPHQVSLDSVQTMILSSFLDSDEKTELLLLPDILITKVLDNQEDEESFFDDDDEEDGDEGEEMDLENKNIIIECLHPYADDWHEELRIDSTVETQIGTLEAVIVPRKEVRFEEGNAYFDTKELSEHTLIVRRWEEGDRIAPFAMEGHTKLVSDILNEADISAYHKKMCVVVVPQNEPKRVLWVPGLRAAEFARVTQSTETVLILRRTQV